MTATFTSQATTFALTVTRNGTGTGTVTSNTGGINCGTACSANIASTTPATQVNLTAAVASGSTFAGWSGACTGTALVCTVTMSQARNVTATFNSTGGTTFPLSVTKAGTGAGTVTSSPGGINCGTTLRRELHDWHVGDAHGRGDHGLGVCGLERRVLGHRAIACCR